MEATEVAEADEVNEAAEVSKGSKITTEDFRVIQVHEFSFNLMFLCWRLWRLVDETQMSEPPKATRNPTSSKFSVLLPLRAI